MDLLNRLWKSRWIDMFFPLSFLSSSLLNVLFFYLGLAYQENPVRSYGFIIGELLFAAMSGLMFLAALKHHKISKVSLAYLGALFLLYCANFAIGLSHFGLSAAIKDRGVHFVFFALPAFLIGICGALSHVEQRFLPLMEQLSFFVLPAGIIYFNGRLFDCSPFAQSGRDLGVMDYMFFAYTIMPFLLVHIFQFCEKAPLEFPVIRKRIPHPQFFRCGLIAIYWIGILGSGTRGAYICVFGTCILLVISQILHRRSVMRPLLISVAIFAVFFFNMCIYAPRGMQAVARMEIFLKGLGQGQLVTSTKLEENQGDLDELVSADNGKQVANLPAPMEEDQDKPEGSASADNENATDGPSGPVEPSLDEGIGITQEIGDRGDLYTLAVKEFLKSPWTGMGLGGYAVKYDEHPHNMILELFCEGGLLFGLPVLILIILAVFRIFRLGWTDRSIRYLFLFFSAYAIRANTIGSVWMSDYLLCAMGYGLTLSASYSRQDLSGRELPQTSSGTDETSI